jgi:predicted  nucleic acid-binding Zn-ribbon protein
MQAERKLEATQETIIDQQQTIEKFRELVRHLQDDITELRERGEKSAGGGGGGADSMAQSQTMMNLNVQLKSTMKAHARVRKATHSLEICLSRPVLNPASQSFPPY